MRLEITGNIDADDVQDKIEEAVAVWMEKIETDNPEFAEVLERVDAVNASKVSVDLQFKLEDSEDWQVLSTDNHEGIPELLVVKAETDDKGELIWDSVEDNDENSDFTEFEALIASGAKPERTEIKSKYDIDLDSAGGVTTIFLDENTAIHIIKLSKEVVVQAYDKTPKKGTFRPVLFAEASFPVSEYDKLVAHYKELAELAS